ncbi:hypothetical protein L2089_20905 [Paenibacillus hunanensis]|uniref:hypothetical protein n=1 Tax=Paenibacillus hunanensis TaxID=539262 RepID=UPI002026C47E|nr:hypothetical protein [Paenibacillus hunanensis]MCL9663147.1 hypothetical protein [Paenibacillus hunanensis]
MLIDLHENFLAKNLPFSYSLKEVEKILKTNFKAVEEDSIYVEDLQKDPYADFEHFYKCYIITDPDILSSIFTTEEIEIHDSMQGKESIPPQDKFEQAWTDIQQGRMLRIAIMSKNGENMTSFTQQGLSERLLSELIVLKGIEPTSAKLGNPQYDHYLEQLHLAGYL